MNSKRHDTQLEMALRECVRGEIRFDAGTRAMYPIISEGGRRGEMYAGLREPQPETPEARP